MRIPILNILLIVACLLTSCNYDYGVCPVGETNDDKVEVTFSMFSTDFIHPTTRAVDETIKRIDLLVFDASGNFLEKVATIIGTSGNTFKARVLAKGKIIHAVANYAAIDTFNETTYLGRSEHVVIPSLLVANNELVFWGRSEIADNQATIKFVRNQAKVSVENLFTNSDFEFVGFDICKYSKTGTVAPYIDGKFNHSTEVATTTTYTLINGVDPTNGDEKYICERKNPESPNETFAVLKYKYRVLDNKFVPLYYRVLLRNADNKPYQIVRNVNYRIKVNNLSATVGVSSFANALTAPALNNFYAEVMKESPSISDSDGNSLTVWPLVHMATSAGIVTSSFQSEGTLGEVTCEIADDPDNVITSAVISGSDVAINVKAVSVKSEAIINVKYGKLERNITVIVSPRYSLNTTTNISSYAASNTPVQLTITIDPTYPSAEDYPTLYPIWCYIKAPNLHPVGDSKGMFMDFEYVEGEYWYTYLAYDKGDHVIEFNTNFSNIANDAIVVRSQYFNESQVVLNSTP